MSLSSSTSEQCLEQKATQGPTNQPFAARYFPLVILTSTVTSTGMPCSALGISQNGTYIPECSLNLPSPQTKLMTYPAPPSFLPQLGHHHQTPSLYVDLHYKKPHKLIHTLLVHHFTRGSVGSYYF